MQKISVYLNYRASNSSFIYWKNKISNVLFRSRLQFKTPSNLEELHRELELDIDEDVDAIISVGGDGTANTIIQKLSGTDIGLLVIPAGTANDLASELGNAGNFNKMIQSIRQKDAKLIDLISINNVMMATNGGIGIGAEVAHAINLLRKRFPLFKKVMNVSGKNIYSAFLVRELFRVKFRKFKIQLSSQHFNEVVETSLLLINNQPVLAQTFNVAPITKNDDGHFNVTLFTHKNRTRLIEAIVRVFVGQIPLDDPDFIQFETTHLRIQNLENESMVFFGDGEVLHQSEIFDINIRPQCLKAFSTLCGKSIDEFSQEVSIL